MIHPLLSPEQMASPIHRSEITKAIARRLDQAGLPKMRFHDLRHSCASLLLELGEHPKIVQEILGHSSIGITMDLYSHVSPQLQRRSMDRLDELIR